MRDVSHHSLIRAGDVVVTLVNHNRRENNRIHS